MPGIALDSGPVVALFSRRDRFHGRAVEFIRDLQAGSLVTTVGVVVEVAYTLGSRAPHAIDWLRSTTRIDDGIVVDLPRITELLRKHRDIEADFADVSIVAMCERCDIDQIATVDADFEIYRTRIGARLSNVF